MTGQNYLYIGISFLVGAAIGGGVSYALTKKDCEMHTQQAIDEMKAAFKEEKARIEDELKKINETRKEDKKKEDNEEEVKQTISETSSIIDNMDDNSDKRTQYNFSSIKKAIKQIKEEKESDDQPVIVQSVIDYNIYLQLSENEYSEKNFTYNAEDESWRDWDSDADYDPEDLPFDPDIVQWNDNEQCYICDKSNHSIFVLEKV